MVKGKPESSEPTSKDLAAHDDWQEISPIGVKFDKPGDTIQGTLIDVSAGTYDNNVYTVTNEKGVFFFFGGAQLDKILPAQIGKEIKVSFQGKEKTKGGMQVKVFRVFMKPAKADEDVPF